MTRAVVFLTAALSAASLGVFAQDVSQQNSQTSVTTSQTNQTTQSAAAGSQNASMQNPSGARDSAQNTAADQHNKGTANANPANGDTQNNGQLPQTSTILPLLGLIGLGSLVAGLFARR